MKKIAFTGITFIIACFVSIAFSQDVKQLTPQQVKQVTQNTHKQEPVRKNKPVKRKSYEKAPAKVIYREEVKKEVK